MNPEHRNRLLNTAITLLTNTDDGHMIRLPGKVMRFSMRDYTNDGAGCTSVKDIHECGTACCVVGLGAYLYNDMFNDESSWSNISDILFGIIWGSEAFDFMFASYLVSDPIYIAQRIIHYYEGKRLLSFNSSMCRDHTRQGLINQLKALILP